MIENLDANGVMAKIEAETGSNELVKAIYQKVSEAPAPFTVDPDVHGLEFVSTNEVRGLKNRSRVKVFIPADGILMAWFYKPSAVHFSRDRYSLGGVVIEQKKFDIGETGGAVTQWLAWLDSGLDPAVRPENWKSAVPYDIPH